MLTPQQVLPFLLHPDSGVRYHAAHYFGDLADASPFETTAELWKAIDQFGSAVNAMGNSELATFLRTLTQVPQDEPSVSRALALLKKPLEDRGVKRLLFRYFACLPLNFVDQHRDEIFAGVDAKTRKLLERRLEKRSMTAEQLWNELLEQGTEAEKADESSAVDSETAEMLGMALVPHADFAIPHAIEVLGDPGDRYWLQIWCIQLLGELRHAPAIDLIIEKMRTDEGDFMHPAATVALGRMDPASVVPKLVECYSAGYVFEDEDDGDEVHIPNLCADALGRIKHPLAEAAAIQLLEQEDDPERTSSLCMALVDLCTTEGLELLRRVVIEERYDAFFSDAKVDLMMLAKMVDYHPPELQAWEKEIKSSDYRRNRGSGSAGLSKETAEMMLRFLERDKPKPARAELPDASYSNQPQRPIRREEPKIGRNDPCPCGSGKKYKKCCGK